MRIGFFGDVVGRSGRDGLADHLPATGCGASAPASRRASSRVRIRSRANRGANFRPLYDLLYDDSLYPDPGNLVIFEGNHDENRLFTALGEDLGLYKIALS